MHWPTRISLIRIAVVQRRSKRITQRSMAGRGDHWQCTIPASWPATWSAGACRRRGTPLRPILYDPIRKSAFPTVRPEQGKDDRGEWLATGQFANLADQTNISAFSRDRAGKRQIVGRRKVVGIDQDDPIQSAQRFLSSWAFPAYTQFAGGCRWFPGDRTLAVECSPTTYDIPCKSEQYVQQYHRRPEPCPPCYEKQ
jgi:hypothetical protein